MSREYLHLIGKCQQDICHGVYDLPAVSGGQVHPPVGLGKEGISRKENAGVLDIEAAGTDGMARRPEHLHLVACQVQDLAVFYQPVGADARDGRRAA